MTIQTARYTDSEHVFGIFVRPDGTETFGPLPPNAGDINAEFEAFVMEGGVIENYVAPEIAAPVELTPLEKLAAASLTVSELKTLLGIK